MPIKTTSLNNHRLSERFKITMKVRISCPDGRSIDCVTQNISEGGVYVLTTDCDFPIGEMVEVQKINNQDDSVDLTNNMAIVVHKEEDGIGLAFVDLNLG